MQKKCIDNGLFTIHVTVFSKVLSFERQYTEKYIMILNPQTSGNQLKNTPRSNVQKY